MAVAFVAFIALLGPGLQLPGWVLDLSPTSHVGNPPLGTVEVLPLVVLGAIAAALGAAGAVGFSGRGCRRADGCCRHDSMGMNPLEMAALNGDGVALTSETDW